MAKLPEPVKVFIVERLAEFRTPQVVADLVKERYGIDIQRGHVAQYSPKYKPRPAEKWVVMHDAHRLEYVKTTAHAGCAHRAVRLATLDRAIGEAERMRNWALLAQLIEIAAKESGDVFTNRQKVEHTDKDGNPFVGGVTVVIEGQSATVLSAQPIDAPAPPAPPDAQPKTP